MNLFYILTNTTPPVNSNVFMCRNCANDCTKFTSEVFTHTSKKNKTGITNVMCSYRICNWCIKNNTHWGDYFCNICFSWITEPGKKLDSRNVLKNEKGEKIKPVITMEAPKIYDEVYEEERDNAVMKLYHRFFKF